MRTKSFGNVIFATLLLLCLLTGMAFPASAKKVEKPSLPSPPDTSAARAVYLYNFESDRAIVSKNTELRIAPASTVKMASGLLAIETLSHRLNETVTVTPSMISGVGGSRLGLKSGDILTVRDLLYASICGGYNDATDILACVVSDSHTTFISRLNQAIRTWGLQDTHYTNPTGMDETGMYTTLDDVITLSRRAIDVPLYMTVSSAISYSFVLKNSGETKLIYNRNALIGPYYYQGVQSKYTKGLIAGMTDNGGHCVATYAEYSGSRYLCVVMGANGSSNGIPNSFSLAYKLLQYAFLNCVYTPVSYAGDVICEANVQLALPKDKEGAATVSCALQEDLYALLPGDAEASDLTFRPYLHHEPISAPITVGSIVGGVDVYYGDTWLCHAKLIAAEDVERNGILSALNTMKGIIFSRRTIISLIALVIILTLYFTISYHNRKKRIATIDFRALPKKQPPKPYVRPRR